MMGPVFDTVFNERLAELLAWRRDVRRFRTDPVPPGLLDRLFDVVQLSPSVGNSQPWRWAAVDDPARRQAVCANFQRCNDVALHEQADERQAAYAALKLEGLRTAPAQFAIFCDVETEQGHGLGRATMPETLAYSTVLAIAAFWLAARARGLGVGWVSILDPAAINAIVDVDPAWRFIAYLCVGWPEEEHIDPELARHGWQRRTDAGRTILQR
ncbi:5,6-dimethylbenzimidazole synthase [Sphingomonas sp. YR710]|uniref:5,6-dimethylbenzimidazole synthase n=1 Tax=Sphingomonas sp. YR710 TaxID=1882773 RepID=UPI000B852C17|nr:5,6-dimethylbenzimidazole synthase [Sphingomonas sp. YR710]